MDQLVVQNCARVVKEPKHHPHSSLTKQSFVEIFFRNVSILNSHLQIITVSTS